MNDFNRNNIINLASNIIMLESASGSSVRSYKYIIDFKKNSMRLINNIKASKQSVLRKLPFSVGKNFYKLPDIAAFQNFRAYEYTDEAGSEFNIYKYKDSMKLYNDAIQLWVLEYKEIWDLVKDKIYTSRLDKTAISKQEIESRVKGLKIGSISVNITGKIDRVNVIIKSNITFPTAFQKKKKLIDIVDVTFTYKSIKYSYGSFGFGMYETDYIISEAYKKIIASDPVAKQMLKYFKYNNEYCCSCIHGNPATITMTDLIQFAVKYNVRIYWGTSSQTRVHILTAANFLTNIDRYTKGFIEKLILNRDKGYIKYYDDYYIIMPEVYEKLEGLFEKFFGKELNEFLDQVKIGDDFKKSDPATMKLLSNSSFTATLYPHQQIASSWIYNLYKNKIPGAILADDMGLGKTPTTIAFLTLAQALNSKVHISVVCPASMVGTWESEIEKFSPNLKNFTIMSYEKAVRSIGNTDILVLDEAQKVKNKTSQAYGALDGIKKKFTLILSGTPIENKVDDIINILGLIDPVMLQLKSMEKVSMEFIRQLRKTVNPIYLQRKKSDVKDMNFTSKLIIKSNTIKPSMDELKLLGAIKLVYGEQVKRLQAQNNFEFYEAQVILAGLMRLRQTISYPGQLPDELRKLLPPKISNNIDNIVPSKFIKLKKLCKSKISKGEKIVIFAEFTGTIKYLKEQLSESYKVVTFTGSDSSSKRKEIIDDFQDNKYDIIIISLRAGNSGITLHSANNVIVYDLWYNPQMLAQAIARVHRIGQTKDVEATFLVLDKTFDKRVYEIIESKREIINHFEGGTVDSKSANKAALELGQSIFGVKKRG